MRLRFASIIFVVVSVSSLSAQRVIAAATPTFSDRLPVRHVSLYKNGVGYFQHDGRISGNQSVTIDFTTAQLNDVLKSLTAIDLNGGRIADVSYNSTAPLQQRMNTLRIPIGADTTAAQFLEALRGARVEVGSGSATSVGRLLSVETVTLTDDSDKKSDRLITQTQISIITDAGELRTFRLSPATGVRLLDQEVNQEVGRYLGLLASERAADVRKMTISTEGSGERELVVSYISEVPVWKSTYRIVLPSRADQKPLLQGWAVVDNTVGEDWDNVELSLVAGAPQSFIQQISQPYYARRPEVGLPELAMLTPQTHEQTLESFAKLQRPPNENAEMGKARGGPSNGIGSGSGGGIGSGTGAGVGAGIAGGYGGGLFLPRQNASVDAVSAMESQQKTASTQEIGDLFEYDIKQPITIRKNQSALVPILQSRVDAEKVTLWSPNQQRALHALWLTNSSGLTLDGGSFSIQEGQTFAGEGLMDAIRPGERRLISYAADPAVEIQSKVKGEGQRVSRVKIHRGVMIHYSEEREHRTYTVRNQDKTARFVVVEHPQRNGWELAGGPKPEETSPSAYRFRVKVDPAQTTTLEFDEIHSVGATYQLSNMTSDEITVFARMGHISPEIERSLRPIIRQKDELASYSEQINSANGKMNAVFEDQKRLRENLKALKGSAEERALVQRYSSELNREEDELAILRKNVADLQSKRELAQQKLDEMITNMEMEVKI
jgi:hypothetical protein